MDSDKPALPISKYEEKDFPAPVLIDSELARLITERGQSTVDRRRIQFGLALVIGCAFGFTTQLVNFNAPVFELYMSFIFLGWVFAYLKTVQITKAFSQRQFDKVTMLLPSALKWTTDLNPFTYFQLVKCLQIQSNLLILEGRFSEFEALTRFNWGVYERGKTLKDQPRNWAIASNLGAAMLFQHNYLAAAKVFADNLEHAKSKPARLTVLCNLTYCLYKVERYEEAEKFLFDAYNLNGKNLDTTFGMRLQYLSASFQCRKGEYEAAEISLNHASELSLKLKQPADFRAYCDGTLGLIRRKQGRFDESVLYYRNAIDVLASADNPSYLDLASLYHELAIALSEGNRETEAAQAMSQAQNSYDFYIKRETDTVNRIKEMVLSDKKLSIGTDLLKVSERVKSIAVLDA